MTTPCDAIRMCGLLCGRPARFVAGNPSTIGMFLCALHARSHARAGRSRPVTAILSADGVHRFRLTRTAAPRPLCRDCADRASPDDPCINDPTYRCESHGLVLFVMLNPSIADAELDDPTIRKCRGFATRWGFASLEVVNLYSLRATKPAALWATAPTDRNTAASDGHIIDAVPDAERIVLAWGQQDKARYRARDVVELLQSCQRALGHDPPRLWCIGGPAKSAMKADYPRHPLMLSYTLPLLEWPQ